LEVGGKLKAEKRHKKPLHLRLKIFVKETGGGKVGHGERRYICPPGIDTVALHRIEKTVEKAESLDLGTPKQGMTTTMDQKTQIDSERTYGAQHYSRTRRTPSTWEREGKATLDQLATDASKFSVTLGQGRTAQNPDRQI